MDTLRVNICYRPLRIIWGICSGDFDAYRRAVRYSHALWGGRFNPIVFIDREKETEALIDLFRGDIVIGVGSSEHAKEFPKKYPYLITPFMHENVFMKGSDESRHWANVLDIYNLLIHMHDKLAWKEFKDEGVSIYTWQDDDPLQDVFLTQFGAYPTTDEVGTDYLKLLLEYANGRTVAVSPTSTIPADTLDHPTISYISRHGLKRHYSIYSRNESPGFYIGSVSNLEDLVSHWNLRACDIPLWFVDPDYSDRYEELIPAWNKKMRDHVSNYRHEWDRRVGIWTRKEEIEVDRKMLGNAELMQHHITEMIWNGLNVVPPTMYFGEASVLGGMALDHGRPKVSFALPDKPFSEDIWFNRQHLIASVSFVGGLYGDEQHTFNAPYLPELNEFYSRTMHFEYNKLRAEPERIGLVIDAADHDAFVHALRVDELMTHLFKLSGYDTKLSSAGLLTRQLIVRLGGLQGGRVFKIPGVRRLLKLHGPNASILKKEALAVIGGKAPEDSSSSFSNHHDLFIGRRKLGENLTPAMVFGHLVEKGLYRIGADLLCPGCGMNSWVPLDFLKHTVTCDMCGQEYDATRQLADSDKWHYRRSGIMGVERNALGAVPVALTLQQLDTSFHGGMGKCIYSPSLELSPRQTTDEGACEVDFVWIFPKTYPQKTAIIIGECKDKGPITSDDVDSLKRVADSLPHKRLDSFVVLSQIAPFSSEQIEKAKTLNGRYHSRVIMLTARELEPYFIYERSDNEKGLKRYGGTPEDMVMATKELYFKDEQ